MARRYSTGDIRKLQAEGYEHLAAVRIALDMLPDALKSDASAYIDGTKDIGNLIQQLKNRRRDGIASSMERVTFNHILIAHFFDKFEDAARMYKAASHSVRKEFCEYVDPLP